MILFYFLDSKQILIYVAGFAPVAQISGKWVIDGEIICNTVSNIGWKYIAEQVLEQGENGFIHDSDYYSAVEKPATITELQEQLAATNAILLDIYLGV